MTKKQKEQIKKLEGFVYAYETFGEVSGKNIDKLYEPITTILDLIKYQEQLIEKLSRGICTLQNWECNRLEVIEYYDKEIKGEN